MGGQACVFYGAAEFSRDCDIVILSDESNLNRLADALFDLLDLARFRPWFLTTDMHDLQAVVRELEAERERERLADIAYWEPLKRELGELRVNKRSKDR